MKTSRRIVLCSALVLSSLGCTKAESEPAKPQATEPLARPTESARLQPEPTPIAPEPQAPPPANTPIDTSAPSAAAEPNGACSFVDPQFFGMLPAKWDGPCQDGKAHGRGILRSYDGKKVAATFYGSMEQGQPKLGVVEDRDGLLIGRFAPGGTPIQSDEFKDRLDGVNEAVAAAKQVSESFQGAGNAASAAFYAKKAKMLDKQIE